jgi:hypothetical protein
MVGRFIAIAVVVSLWGPLVGPWAAASGAGPGCRGGVCVCAHHPREQPAEKAPCHGAHQAQEPRCELRAACHHEVPGVAAPLPFLIPPIATLLHQAPSVAVTADAQRLPLSGLRPVEPQPPRAS